MQREDSLFTPSAISAISDTQDHPNEIEEESIPNGILIDIDEYRDIISSLVEIQREYANKSFNSQTGSFEEISANGISSVMAGAVARLRKAEQNAWRASSIKAIK